MSVILKFSAFTKRHPIVRGMLSYAAIWPTSCVIQQKIAGQKWDNVDWIKVGRFGLYGAFFTAPTLYAWVRISTKIWPSSTFKTAITKALVEQLTYGPAALASFYFGMTMLEGKSVEEACEQVKLKFFPSYKVAICVWPFLQTVNFCFIPERNRVPFVSMCSLIWCCFLAYMHQIQMQKQAKV